MSSRLKSFLLIAFLFGGLWLVKTGALPAAAWVGLVILVMFTRLLPRLDAYREELQVTDDGVVRKHGSRLRKTTVESVRWEEVRAVELRARETGPGREQMLFLLFGRDGNGVAVPGPLAQQHGLAQALAQHLPGLRQDLIAEAAAASEPATFTLWEAEPREADQAPASSIT